MTESAMQAVNREVVRELADQRAKIQRISEAAQTELDQLAASVRERIEKAQRDDLFARLDAVEVMLQRLLVDAGLEEEPEPDGAGGFVDPDGPDAPR